MRKPVDAGFKWMNPDGTPTQYFAELIQSMWDRTTTVPVSKNEPANGQFLVYRTSTKGWELQPSTPPSNGEVLIYNSGTGTWEPGSN